MIKQVRVSVLALAVLCLSGCASDDVYNPEPSGRGAFVEEMRTVDALSEFPDKRLVIMGENVCTSLREGATVDEMVLAFAETGYETEDALTIITVSARTFCREVAL